MLMCFAVMTAPTGTSSDLCCSGSLGLLLRVSQLDSSVGRPECFSSLSLSSVYVAIKVVFLASHVSFQDPILWYWDMK